jgi:tryptophan synthase alpha subunit
MSWESKPTYIQLASSRVSSSKNLVISSCSAGGFTLAQQLVSIDPDTGERQTVFLKGACKIRDIDALKEFYKAIGMAIRKAENIERIKNAEDGIEWDDEKASN